MYIGHYMPIYQYRYWPRNPESLRLCYELEPDLITNFACIFIYKIVMSAIKEDALEKSSMSKSPHSSSNKKLSLRLFSGFVNTICKNSCSFIHSLKPHRLRIKTHAAIGHSYQRQPTFGCSGCSRDAAVGLFSAAGKPIWLQEQQAAQGSDNPLWSRVVDRRLTLQADTVML